MRLGISILLGYVLGVCNLYVATKVGYSVGVAFLTAFTWGLCDQGIAWFFSAWKRSGAADLACYLSLTSAMSCGSVTVIATALSAMLLQEHGGPTWAMAAWVAGLCCLGTCLALPLRASMLANYPFPSGKVAGQLVRQLEQGGSRGSFFLPVGLVWLWMFLRERFGVLPARLVYGYWSLEMSPMLFGLGALLGFPTTSSMLLGGLLFYWLIPWQLPAWEPHVLWFAVGMIVAATTASLVQFKGAFSSAVPRSTLVGGPYAFALIGGILLLSLGYFGGWGLSSLWGLLLLPIIVLFAHISSSVTGQTDVVPTGALGKLSILGLGLVPGLREHLMLHTGTLTGSAAAAADFLTDLRCGEQLGCSPQRQFRFQLAGAVLGPFCFVPTFLWLTRDRLGSEAFPVPAAKIWLGVAGLGDAVSTHGHAIVMGLFCGVLLELIRKGSKGAWWVPQAIPLAMAAMLDMGTCMMLALGGLVSTLLKNKNWTITWSALVCAEALAAVFLFLL